jgi:putative membrane protein PagO
VTEHPRFAAVTTQSWLGVIYLGVVASVIGFAVYFYLLKHISAVSLSFVFVFFPVIAIGVSSVAEHDHLGPLALAMAGGMLGSFALTKRGQR